jgi:hypothetical protein
VPAFAHGPSPSSSASARQRATARWPGRRPRAHGTTPSLPRHPGGHGPGEPGHREVFSGRAACDAMVEPCPGEVTPGLGALTPRAMARIGDGLRAALDFSS